MTHPTNGLPAPARAAFDELVNFCVTLEKSVQDRFKPYRAMFRAFALVDPTYRPADNTLEYLADRTKLGQMCDSYFKLDGGSALSQMDDFRATYKPLQHCEEGENPMSKKAFEMCEDDISLWYDSEKEAWKDRFKDYTELVKVGSRSYDSHGHQPHLLACMHACGASITYTAAAVKIL